MVVWLIGLVVVLPYICALELRADKCEEDFEAAGMVTGGYTIGVFVAQYLVPLSIIMISYLRLVFFNCLVSENFRTGFNCKCDQEIVQ